MRRRKHVRQIWNDLQQVQERRLSLEKEKKEKKKIEKEQLEVEHEVYQIDEQHQEREVNWKDHCMIIEATTNTDNIFDDAKHSILDSQVDKYAATMCGGIDDK